MNIKQAKEQIKKTMQVYFAKDEFGEYSLEVSKQRPIFLMGPPGIGKTAVMQQVAAELGVGLVTYSMTHHTRQSALGLPFIMEKEFGGRQYHIAEYTMSEIVAAVYNKIEEDGCREGILFLDEMNCVSETLAPAMLQFLQYKTFGMHQIPAGWLVVTAGNPPEYNNSVREFDLATWDRLKRMDIEPDFEAWKDYAKVQGIHAAVLAFLGLHPDYFYEIERTIDGRQFVTARGWEDLSLMLQLYEQQGLAVDGELFGQYIQHPQIAEDFALYYDLFLKYRMDYNVEQILQGTADDAVGERAAKAPFDERITLSGLLEEALTDRLAQTMKREQSLLALRDWLKEQKSAKDDSLLEALQRNIRDLTEEYKAKKSTGTLSRQQKKEYEDTLHVFLQMKDGLAKEDMEEPGGTFDRMKNLYEQMVAGLQTDVQEKKQCMEHVFAFVNGTFGNGTEMLLLLSELTKDADSSRFLARYGSEAYTKYSAGLMVQERQNQILDQLLS